MNNHYLFIFVITSSEEGPQLCAHIHTQPDGSHHPAHGVAHDLPTPKQEELRNPSGSGWGPPGRACA